MDIELMTFKEYLEKWVPSWAKTIEIKSEGSYYKQLLAISKYYKEKEQEIISQHNKNKSIYYDPYPIDWSQFFTPIESYAWNDIRMKGGIVLYPQYPVLNYHIDFANPGMKIGLELDGAKFHDKDRDLIRDNKLRDAGWIIYRISGKEMNNYDFRSYHYYMQEGIEDEFEAVGSIHQWLLESGNGVIEAIKQVHFNDDHSRFYSSNIGERFISYCHKTLDRHQLTEQNLKWERDNG